jgi:Fe-S-cluster-containing dehydrogenase component
MPAAFLFDPNRCTGCQACELACSIENDLGPDRSWREVVTFNDASAPGIPRFHLSLACNHCAEPACMYSCPALAYDRDATSGAVLLDPARCIGCRYCSWACPYGAPRFEEESGVMGKCTFCSHRLGEGLKPACATLCPTGALDFADLPASELGAHVEGLPRTALGPSIRIEPVRRPVRRDAGADPGDESEFLGRPLPTPSPGITLRSEWSLAAFTFLTALLFAAFVAATAGALPLSPVLFASTATVAAGLSLSHLGRPARAWRAGLNIRRSWLSREVLGFGSFAAAGTAALVMEGRGEPVVGVIGVVLGLLTLVSADLVYRPVYRGPHPLLDGGGALLTGLYLAGLVLGNPWLAGIAGAFKLTSEARWGFRLTADGKRQAGALTVPRILLGVAIPAAAWIASGAPLPTWVLLGAIVGEALGRAAFYTRLRLQSPTRQARADLASRLAATSERSQPTIRTSS